MTIGSYDLLVTFTNHIPNNDMESLVYTIFACALYVLVVSTIPYLITVMSQIFNRR